MKFSSVRVAVWLGICVVVLCVGGALAQGCGVVMVRHYSAYHSESSDGTNFYTSVLTDGYADCTPTPSCPCGTAQHTPYSYNKLGSVGGWAHGNSSCASCYLSYQNNQTFPASPNTIVTFVGEGEVVCSLAGTFFTLSFPSIQIELAYTKGKFTGTTTELGPDGTVSCSVQNWCTAATTPPKCGLASVVQHPLVAGEEATCWQYYNTTWVWEKIGSSSPWCIPLIPGQNAVGTNDSTLYACTH